MKFFIRSNDWLNSIHAHERGWGNGYVAIPKSSSWHGVHYDSIPVEIHGGLTYSELASEGGFAPSDVAGDDWIIGFDTNHYSDNPTSCDKAYVEREAKNLLNQMQALEKTAFVVTVEAVICPNCEHRNDVTDKRDGDYYKTLNKINCENCQKTIYFKI